MGRRKLSALLLAGSLLTGLLSPMLAAAAANRAVEVPVNFTDSDWKDDWEAASLTQLELWGVGEQSSYSDSYTVSYKLYIPESFIKEGSAINIATSLSFNDTGGEEWKWAGWADCPGAEFQSDGRFTTWDEASEKDVEIDYAAAKNKAIYLDDLKIVKEDGTAVVNQNFNSAKELTDIGIARLAPNLGDADGKKIRITELPSAEGKTLTVSKKTLNVKVGRKVKIKATAAPKAKITYASSDKKVAAVNAKGEVTGKKAGKATITVKANGKTVKVTVTVKK